MSKLKIQNEGFPVYMKAVRLKFVAPMTGQCMINVPVGQINHLVGIESDRPVKWWLRPAGGRKMTPAIFKYRSAHMLNKSPQALFVEFDAEQGEEITWTFLSSESSSLCSKCNNLNKTYPPECYV